MGGMEVERVRLPTTSTSHRPVGRGKVVFSPDCRPGRRRDRAGFSPATISVLQSTYPLKLHVPEHASSSPCQWVYPITYGGGLVEGDVIQYSVEVEAGCNALVTTQSSTKAYHCQGGGESRQLISHKVGVGSLLVVLPDPLVPFTTSSYSQQQTVDMSVSGNLVLLDWSTAGRVARGEVWDFTRINCSNTVSVEGKTVLRDTLAMSDAPYLSLRDAMANYSVVGVLILLGPKLAELCNNLLNTLGKPKPIGGIYNTEKMLAVSPLKYNIKTLNPETNTSKVTEFKGCIMKFCTPSVSSAYDELESILQPLFPIFGGNPFTGKH